jgi:hypothetical protein
MFDGCAMMAIAGKTTLSPDRLPTSNPRMLHRVVDRDVRGANISSFDRQRGDHGIDADRRVDRRGDVHAGLQGAWLRPPPA